MMNQMKADLFRIFKGKAIFITLILFLVMTFSSVYMLSPGHIGFSMGSASMSEEEIAVYGQLNNIFELREYQLKHQAFDLDRACIGQNNNLYYFFIVIVILVLCTDFSNKTIKNAISTSTSRKQYFLSKTLLIFFLCTGLILLSNYGTHVMNLLINGKKFTTSLYTITKLTIYQLPLLYGIISLLCCMGFIIRRLSLFNGISIPFLMVFQLMLMSICAITGNNHIMNYEFQTALDFLVNHPTNKFILECVLLGCSYIVLFNALGYYSLKKADIK